MKFIEPLTNTTEDSMKTLMGTSNNHKFAVLLVFLMMSLIPLNVWCNPKILGNAVQQANHKSLKYYHNCL